MARLRYNGLSTTLGGSGLTSGGTSITFAAALTYNGGTAVPTITGSDYIPLAILDSSGKLAEVVYLTAYTTAGTTGTVTRGQEGTSGASTRAAGLKVAQAPTTRDVGLVSYAEVTRTAGDITLNSTAIAAVSTDLDLTLNASVGDLIEFGISGLYNAVAQGVGMDLYTLVSGSAVNPFGPGVSASLAGANGSIGWFGPSSTGATIPLSGSVTRVLTSGDISSGTVTLRLFYAKTTTTARLLFASTSLPMKVWAKNHGPV